MGRNGGGPRDTKQSSWKKLSKIASCLGGCATALGLLSCCCWGGAQAIDWAGQGLSFPPPLCADVVYRSRAVRSPSPCSDFRLFGPPLSFGVLGSARRGREVVFFAGRTFASGLFWCLHAQRNEPLGGVPFPPHARSLPPAPQRWFSRDVNAPSTQGKANACCGARCGWVGLDGVAPCP